MSVPVLSEKTMTRSKSRVRELAEVFTRPREVNAMLDLIMYDKGQLRQDFDIETARFLEPTCGNGQFLVEILARKCEAIMRSPSDGWTDCTRILRALAGIYAIDIDETNVQDSRNRLFHLALAWRELITGALASQPWALAAYSILQQTVIRGDFLFGVMVHEVTVTDGWQLVLKPHLIEGSCVKDAKGMYRKRNEVVDTISPERRSEIMRRVRSKDTGPEMTVRRLLYSMGYRYRLHRKGLPGKPDIVFAGRKKAIFVHGCYWHGHEDPSCRGARRPKSNQGYWDAKLSRNKQRDAANVQTLQDMRWSVLIVWECQIKDLEALRSRLDAFMK